MDTLRITLHAKERFLERVFDITKDSLDENSYLSELNKVDSMFSLLSVWSDFHSSYIIEEHDLIAIIADDSIVTFCPIKNNYSAIKKDVRKIKKEQKRNQPPKRKRRNLLNKNKL